MENQQVSSLVGPGELLRKTFQIYKSRIGVFLGIAVIPFLVYLLFIPFFLLPLFFNLSFIAFYKSLGLILLPLTLSVMIVLGIMAFVVNLWASIALLYAIKERDQKIGIKESFTKGWSKILSYWWISILVGLITMVGFLLFIIPGIIFSLWFSLAGYVLVSEDIKGMKALFRSKQLIKGYWWKVFWRYLALTFLIILVLCIVGFIPFVRNIIYIFITPFSVTFSFLIYENLKQLKCSKLTT
ncbi:hypothetical protein KJA13_00430 [Patescibacteria group bacterium]|nr:hypothetical protein [Patescibacteria group bacterium]